MIATALTAMLALTGQVEAEQPAFRRGPVDSDSAMNAIVTRASQDALDAYRRQNHRKNPLEAVAVYDVATGLIRIDLRGGELPGEGGAELEDLQGFISNGALEAARPIVPATGTKFLYNGREFDDQYPDDSAGNGGQESPPARLAGL